jgi:predicted TIM-barrel fold metal-dependent hydrolase
MGDSGQKPFRIDTHHHIIPPNYLAKERARIERMTHALFPRVAAWTPDKAVAEMDRYGIEAAIVSLGTPGVWFGDAAHARALARDYNDYGARVMADHKGRFGLFAALPLPDVDSALREIEHAFDTLHADGVGLLTNEGDVWPGDPRLAPVFDELNRRKAVVYFHPTAATFLQGVIPQIPDPMLEFPFDTTRAIMSLLASGTLARCPDIRFIFSHAGGTLPMLSGRIARVTSVRPDIGKRAPQGVLHEFRKLYFDLSGAFDPIAFNAVREMAGMSQLLFGTDYPFWSPEINVTGVDALPVGASELQAVRRDNALRLFPRFATQH